MLTQLSTLKARLGILESDPTFDALLTSAIAAVTARFDQETNRTLARTEDASYEFDAGETELAPPGYPIEAVTKFEMKTSEAEGWVEQNGIDYLVRRRCIISLRYALSIINPQPSAFRVIYTGGYVLPGEPDPQVPPPGIQPARLPADLEQAAVEQAAFWFQRRDQLGLKISWPRGGVYQQFASQDLLEGVAAVLKSYRRLSP